MNEIKRLLSYAKNMRRYFVIIGSMSILTALLSLGTPYVMKLATDWIVSIVKGQEVFSWNMLFILAGLQLILSLLTIIATDVGGWYGDITAVKIRRQLSTTYYMHLLKLPQSYYDNEVTGKIINRLSRAISDIGNFLQFFANNMLQILLTMTVTLVVLAFYSWPLAVLCLLFIPVNLYLTAKTSDKWQKLEAKKNTQFDIASGRFAEVVGQIRLVKSFGSQDRELNYFDSRIKKMIGITKKQSLYWHKMNALRGVVFGVLFVAIYTIMFYEAANENLTIGDLVLLISLVQGIAFPLRNLSFFVDSYQRAVANSKDFVKAMQEKPEVEDSSDRTLQLNKAEIHFSDVSFGYKKSEQVLSRINFTIEAGKKVALVGESGGGKTTISNLLMRLYRPTDGAVLIDGQDINDVSLVSLRSAIATVFQDAALFSGTIRENISYGKPDASDEEIITVAKAANAHAFIKKLKDGYETEIGERGIKLSGGQKQRLAIARALLKDAPILILDEATSSLDSRSEVTVQEALNRLMKNRTVLIIAHRLSTIAHVDAIVTLKEGRVDEIGTPHALAKTNGIYAQLLELQHGTDDNAKKQLAQFEITE